MLLYKQAVISIKSIIKRPPLPPKWAERSHPLHKLKLIVVDSLIKSATYRSPPLEPNIAVSLNNHTPTNFSAHARQT